MDNIGGAELVTLALARGFDADVYTTSLNVEKIKAMGYADIAPRITSVGAVPKMAPFRQQLALWKMRTIDANKLLAKKIKQQKESGKQISEADARPYDFFIIAGDWAMSAAVKNKPNMWYVHSPLNELWHFSKWIRQTLLSPMKRPLFDIFTWFNRELTRGYAKHVGIWVTNSRNVQARTRKYYGVESVVINPPVIMSKSEAKPSLQGDSAYWLSVNRLFSHKRVEIQMKAMSLLPEERMIMVGSYEKGAAQFEAYKAFVESIKPANVELVHWLDDVDLRKLYSECKGFIATSKEEDFGLTVVEAMACGKPVIASNEGGYKESIIDGKTGKLVDYINAPAENAEALAKNSEALADAIKQMSAELRLNPDQYRHDCIGRAEEFDVEVFIQKIKDQIEAYQRKAAK